LKDRPPFSAHLEQQVRMLALNGGLLLRRLNAQATMPPTASLHGGIGFRLKELAIESYKIYNQEKEQKRGTI